MPEAVSKSESGGSGGTGEGPIGGALDDGWLVAHISAAGTAEDIVPLLERKIREGALPPGTRLPTIRTLSQQTGASFRAISDSWAVLRRKGLIETRRRGGTIVADAGIPQAERTLGTRNLQGPLTTADLAHASSDLALLPRLEEALAAGLTSPGLHSNVRPYITERLRAVAADEWPFDAEAYVAGGSGAEAALLSIGSLTAAGGKIAIDEPVNPGFLNHVRRIGLEPIGIRADGSGPSPDALTAAIASGARTYLSQPAGPYAMTPPATRRRLEELAEVLAAGDVVIVEDDGAGPLADVAAPTLGKDLPGRVVRVRAYCRSYGVDLRTSIIGGPEWAIQRIRDNRSYGLGVNSRIMQDALAFLIESRAAAQTLKHARDVYRRRKNLLVQALQQRGIASLSGPNGQFIWVQAASEVDTLVDLAAAGYSVGAGSQSFCTPPATGYLRIATLRLPDDAATVGKLADAISLALGGQMRDLYT